eukprot:3663828-Rhodomonas_salina.2
MAAGLMGSSMERLMPPVPQHGQVSVSVMVSMTFLCGTLDLQHGSSTQLSISITLSGNARLASSRDGPEIITAFSSTACCVCVLSKSCVGDRTLAFMAWRGAGSLTSSHTCLACTGGAFKLATYSDGAMGRKSEGAARANGGGDDRADVEPWKS